VVRRDKRKHLNNATPLPQAKRSWSSGYDFGLPRRIPGFEC